MVKLGAPKPAPESKSLAETRVPSNYSEIQFGYCRKFPDNDQILTYCFLRLAGLVNSETPVKFLSGRTHPDTLLDSSIAKIEAAYNLISPDDPDYDPNLSDPTQGNYTHRIINGTETTAAAATYSDQQANIAEAISQLYPDRAAEKMQIINRIAEYIQTLELGEFTSRGIKQPSLTSLFEGAQFAYYAHPALGNSETNPEAGLEACYQIFLYLIETEQDPFNTIDTSNSPELTSYEEVNRLIYEHDRPIMARLRPEVIQTTTGINIAYLDAREAAIGEAMINPKGGFGQLGRYADVHNGLKSDVGILVSDHTDVEGNILGTKVQVNLNFRSPQARAKLEAQGVNLADLVPIWNDLEYSQGIGPDELQVGINSVGGHFITRRQVGGKPTLEHQTYNEQVMTIINAPAETGTGLNPQIIRRAIEQYFDASEHFTESEMRDAAKLIGYPDVVIKRIPQKYPNQDFSEMAFFACKHNPHREAPNFHQHSDECLVFVARESELTTTRGGQNELTSAQTIYPEEKQAAAQTHFDRYLTQSPRKALELIARGDVEAKILYKTPEKLLAVLEGIGNDQTAIAELFDPQNTHYDPKPQQLTYYLRDAVAAKSISPDLRDGIETTKFTHPEVIVSQFNNQVLPQILEGVRSLENSQDQERLLTVILRILQSHSYQAAQVRSTMRDQLGFLLLEMGLNNNQDFAPEIASRAQEQLAGSTLNPANKQRILRSLQLSHAADPTYLKTCQELLAIEVTSSDTQPFIEQDRHLPTQLHIALIVGRQQRVEDGADILDVIQNPDGGVGPVDFALRRNQLTSNEITEAEAQLVSLIEHATIELLDRLPEGETGTIKITHQLFGMLSVRLGHQIARLSDAFPGKLHFELYQWVQGTYQKVGEL